MVSAKVYMMLWMRLLECSIHDIMNICCMCCEGVRRYGYLLVRVEIDGIG